MSQETQKVIAVSALTSLTVLALAGFIVWNERVSLARSVLMGNVAARVDMADMAARQDAVIAVVHKADPAVVAISVSKTVQVQSRNYSGPFGDLFEDLFGPTLPPGQGSSRPVEVGGGSGFFVTSDGYIITNKHVVSDEQAEYVVYTNDGKRHPARVVARDPFIDIALLKVDGSGFSYLSFSEAAPATGQTAVAIGNALGEFQNTVSVGVVSGLSRSIVAGDRIGGQSEILDEVIQTDAAINPGNSGGPLLDLSGNVIGVNVAVALGSENIAFALPVTGLADIVRSVTTTGIIVHPYLGIRYEAITPAIRESQNLSVDYGVVVQGGDTAASPAVIAGSPAAKAGIVAGDIILEVDGIRLTSDQKLSTIIRGKKVGQVVTLKILRQGRERVVQITLEGYKG